MMENDGVCREHRYERRNDAGLADDFFVPILIGDIFLARVSTSYPTVSRRGGTRWSRLDPLAYGRFREVLCFHQCRHLSPCSPSPLIVQLDKKVSPLTSSISPIRPLSPVTVPIGTLGPLGINTLKA